MFSHASLRVNSVFSDDVSCLAIHEVICIDKTPRVLMYWFVISVKCSIVQVKKHILCHVENLYGC